MCRRFLLIPRNVVDEIIKEMLAGRMLNRTPDRSAVLPSVFPNMESPVIVDEQAALSTRIMSWGYERSWCKGPLFNTRIETATRTDENMWAESLHSRRCVIASYGFYESHKTEKFLNPRSGKENKQQYLFTLPDSSILFLAGVYESGRFSIATTAPNISVAPIHDRMPIVLHQSEVATWLTGDYLSLADRSNIELISKVST